MARRREDGQGLHTVQLLSTVLPKTGALERTLSLIRILGVEPCRVMTPDGFMSMYINVRSTMPIASEFRRAFPRC